MGRKKKLKLFQAVRSADDWDDILGEGDEHESTKGEVLLLKLHGSYRRLTKVRARRDIDVLVSFNYDAFVSACV